MGYNEKFNRSLNRIFAVTSHCAGIVTIASGTTVASVATLMAQSGAIILTFPQQYANFANSGQAIQTQATSVGGGRFIIEANPAPANDMPVAWFAVGRTWIKTD